MRTRLALLGGAVLAIAGCSAAATPAPHPASGPAVKSCGGRVVPDEDTCTTLSFSFTDDGQIAHPFIAGISPAPDNAMLVFVLSAGKRVAVAQNFDPYVALTDGAKEGDVAFPQEQAVARCVVHDPPPPQPPVKVTAAQGPYSPHWSKEPSNHWVYLSPQVTLTISFGSASRDSEPDSCTVAATITGFQFVVGPGNAEDTPLAGMVLTS